MKAKYWVTGTKEVLLAVALLFGTQAAAQTTFAPDHYISYKIKTLGLATHDISLQDKFISWTEFRVSTPSRLLNPAIKIHNGNTIDINNPDLHYALYNLKNPEGDITVNQAIQVSNQFGEFNINQLTVAHLLVPSQSLLPFTISSDDPLANSEHYLCYDIPETAVTVAQEGTVSDEFRTRDFIVTKAKHLCVPTAKIHHEKLYNIQNDVATNNLMCFSLAKKRILKFLTLVNQFSSKGVMVTKDKELCLPSTVTIPD